MNDHEIPETGLLSPEEESENEFFAKDLWQEEAQKKEPQRKELPEADTAMSQAGPAPDETPEEITLTWGASEDSISGEEAPEDVTLTWDTPEEGTSAEEASEDVKLTWDVPEEGTSAEEVSEDAALTLDASEEGTSAEEAAEDVVLTWDTANSAASGEGTPVDVTLTLDKAEDDVPGEDVSGNVTLTLDTPEDDAAGKEAHTEITAAEESSAGADTADAGEAVPVKEDQDEAPAPEEPKKEPKEPLPTEKNAAVIRDRKRLVLTGIAILLEAGLFLMLSLTKLSRYTLAFEVGLRVLSVLVVLGIYCRHRSSSFKMPWIFLIMATPVLGIFLYIFIGLSGTTRRMRKRYEKSEAKLIPYLQQDPAPMYNLYVKAAGAAGIAAYLHKYVSYPVYQNTDVEYFDDAAKALEAQKAAMRSARKFIFMEYHAIEDAETWKEIREILEEKVRQGVEVRVFYDDLGNFGIRNKDFARSLQESGIECRVFHPLFPLVNLFLDNRDCRRLTVVDGEVGFTGDYNLCDEYFHIKEPYGHWKDTGIRLQGKAVDALTITFLTMWNAVKETDKTNADYQKYLFEAAFMPAENGFVQPYADAPMDKLQVGEDVCMSMIEQARSYVYIMTPSLIITDEMAHALCLAARRGVDVRIVTPGIPDKKLTGRLTASWYANLVSVGVRIFAYSPGYCHARMCVCDDIMAVCGDIGTDCRSMFRHFENGCFMAGCRAVMEIKADFDRTFALCEEVTEEYTDDRSVFVRFGQTVLRLAAPLL